MELNVQHLDFIQLLNIFEMCQRQERTRKLIVYQFVYIVVILTIPITITMMKWTFSIMNIIKLDFAPKYNQKICLCNLLIKEGSFIFVLERGHQPATQMG